MFVGPNTVFTNDRHPRAPALREDGWKLVPTLVRRGASIGANAVIVCGCAIGQHAVIGAGSVVTRDVPDHAVVVGNPAHRVGWACACGEGLDEGLGCGCGRRYRVENVDGRQALRSAGP